MSSRNTLEGLWVHPAGLAIFNPPIPSSIFYLSAGSDLPAIDAILTDPSLCNAAIPAVPSSARTGLDGVG